MERVKDSELRFFFRCLNEECAMPFIIHQDQALARMLIYCAKCDWHGQGLVKPLIVARGINPAWPIGQQYEVAPYKRAKEVQEVAVA